jgi:hypothetical protein
MFWEARGCWTWRSFRNAYPSQNANSTPRKQEPESWIKQEDTVRRERRGFGFFNPIAVIALNRNHSAGTVHRPP